MKPRFAHILAFGSAAWSTVAGFESALQTAKAAGFNLFVVLPMLFEQAGLTKEQVVTTAKKHDMKLTSCGFLPGDKFSPYTNEGRQLAIQELRKQFRWQVHFNQNGVGEKNVCGPVFDAWRGNKKNYTSSGFLAYITQVRKLMEEMDLVLSVEIVNAEESGIPNADVVIPESIVYLDSRHIKLHFDIVHIASYVGMARVMRFLKQNKDIIGVIELGMPGRHAMKDTPEFVAIAKEFFAWLAENRPNIAIGVEQFDYETVIVAFGLTEIYGSTSPGVVVFNADTTFLLEHGVLK